MSWACSLALRPWVVVWELDVATSPHISLIARPDERAHCSPHSPSSSFGSCSCGSYLACWSQLHLLAALCCHQTVEEGLRSPIGAPHTKMAPFPPPASTVTSLMVGYLCACVFRPLLPNRWCVR